MITPLVQEYLSAYLQGHRSADDTRQILRLIDGSERNDGPLEAEFDRVLHRVSQKIPGLTIDFDKLLADDEIECDPLISHGNLALLRLDAIFRQAFTAWTHSGAGLHKLKRITKPEDPATYSARTEKHERTEETYPPDAQLLNQVVNITLSGFRIQATITHRRDQLKKATETGQPIDQVSRDATRSASPPQQSSSSQPEALARNASQFESPPEIDLDVIGPQESLSAGFDNLSAPIEGTFPLLIRGINKLGILRGYDKLESLTKTQPIAQQPSAKTSSATVAFRSAKERPATDNALASSPECDCTPCSEPRAPCSDCGTPRFEHAEVINNESPRPREEEPVNAAQMHTSSSPTDHWPLTTGQFPTKPAYHKRE